MHSFNLTKILSALMLVMVAFGCGAEDVANDVKTRMVYVDTESREAVVTEKSNTVPVINPSTGKRTLMPGLYCSKCEKWYPAPPPERINSVPGAGLCPETQNPLSADGPWPTDDTE